MTRYLAITPVRDEERFLPALIESMRAQSVLPACWIIVNDGSTDRSAEIIESAARECAWIKPRQLLRGGDRKSGGESIIMQFIPDELLRGFEFVARFDADLEFGPDYIELLFREFARDPSLGIASGSLMEPSANGWEEHVTPIYHTRGPSKFYSRECFVAIGGLESGLGWDSIDEARAMMAGYRTRNFRHIKAFPKRIGGSARGLWRGRMEAGHAAFAAGYSPSFMLARAIWQGLSPPFGMGGAFMLVGFVAATLKGEHRLADRALIRFIRTQQRRRLMLRESLWR
ncbi:MAG: glycosyltransferase family A protein [Chthoniobacterales bacterium]